MTSHLDDDLRESVEVVDVPRRNRFEILVDGESAGYCEYHERPDGSVAMPHTVIDPRWRGRGLGEQLVAGAVEEILGRGHTIVPLCWFVAEYLQRQPKPQSVQPEDQTDA